MVRLHGGTRRSVPAALWKPVAVLVLARLFMGGAMYVYQHVTGQFVINNWDGGWYVYAAEHGWPHRVLTGLGDAGQDTLAFFPGLPAIIRIVHFVLPLNWIRAGEVAAFLTQVAMVIGLWLLTRDVWGHEVADRAVILLCFFPAAFIFAMMYSEPLLIAAACFCILALRRRWWIVAGLAAAIGGLTRVVGLALVACCIWEAYWAIRTRREWRSLSSVVLAPLGVVGWFAYLWASTGDRNAWLDTERNGWAQHSTFLAIPRLIKAVLHDHPAHPNDFLPLISTILAVVLLIVLIHSRAPGVLIVYAVAVLLISATSVNPSGIRFRFVMTAFPLIMVMGYRLRGDAYALVVAASSILMTSMMVVTLTGATLIP
jgi:hypothetical protein